VSSSKTKLRNPPLPIDTLWKSCGALELSNATTSATSAESPAKSNSIRAAATIASVSARVRHVERTPGQHWRFVAELPEWAFVRAKNLC
jgi:hypothetical protein